MVHFPTHGVNGDQLRQLLPWLRPTPLGLATTVGFGDRLGLATPGHIRALRSASQNGSHRVLPIFAQQSVRELTRTRRTAQEVLNAATWGAFEGGWRDPLGADADHLKTTADVDLLHAAGFVFFTIDPGAHVDGAAAHDDAATLERKFAALPWPELETTPEDTLTHGTATLDLTEWRLEPTREAIMRAAVKYGRAVAHVTQMARHVAAKGTRYELEISVDETDEPTTFEEHAYIARELRRLGVKWISLAPRFIGRFEKGVDYIGDLPALARCIQGHAAIAEALGPYKLSLHSGSDKFSVYPLAMEATRGLVHLKTAGTSYLEALRVLAQKAPPLFRQIVVLARERYATDCISYHVSADVAKMPALAKVPDPLLPNLLDEFNTREALHVTYGSALDELGTEIRRELQQHAEAYAITLEHHFSKHLLPFVHE
jgi:hypothetical protein